MIFLSVVMGLLSGWEAYTWRMTGFAVIFIASLLGRKQFVNYYWNMRKTNDRDKYPVITD